MSVQRVSIPYPYRSGGCHVVHTLRRMLIRYSLLLTINPVTGISLLLLGPRHHRMMCVSTVTSMKPKRINADQFCAYSTTDS